PGPTPGVPVRGRVLAARLWSEQPPSLRFALGLFQTLYRPADADSAGRLPRGPGSGMRADGVGTAEYAADGGGSDGVPVPGPGVTTVQGRVGRGGILLRIRWPSAANAMQLAR